jgi:hypothetical protein
LRSTYLFTALGWQFGIWDIKQTDERIIIRPKIYLSKLYCDNNGGLAFQKQPIIYMISLIGKRQKFGDSNIDKIKNGFYCSYLARVFKFTIWSVLFYATAIWSFDESANIACTAGGTFFAMAA